jgi:protein-tyrosine kinase
MKGLKLGGARSRRPLVGAKPMRVRETAAAPAGLSHEGYVFSAALVRPSQMKEGEILVGLAQNVIEHHVALGRRGLAVCGASSGAGVSFVAANLAMALARGGVTTLLIDTNLHRPALEDLIRPPSPAPGLYEVLEGRAPSSLDVARIDVLPQLSIVYAGRGEAAPSELLASERFRAFALTCLRDFPCVIFDTPPANRSPDARAVAAVAGYALLVAQKHRSYFDDLSTLTEQLEQDRVTVIGSVLNDA